MITKEAPDFHTGKIVLVSSKAAAISLLLMLWAYYVWINQVCIYQDGSVGCIAPYTDLVPPSQKRDKLYGTEDDEVTRDDGSEIWVSTLQRMKGER